MAENGPWCPIDMVDTSGQTQNSNPVLAKVAWSSECPLIMPDGF